MTRPPLFRSLSARLLVLTMAFVLLAEVLIFAPSIGRFRLVWLEERLAAGHLAALAVEAAPDRMVTEELEARLLDHVGAYLVDLAQPDARVSMLVAMPAPRIDQTYDLREAGAAGLIAQAFAVLARRDNRVIRVVGGSPKDPRARVELVMNELPLAEALRDYAARIAALSVVISVITAGLVYLSLHRLMVRPMRRITGSMVAFRRDSEHAAIILPGARADEIGQAQRELAEMQATLRTALRQRERLAALGTAVTKINHDLRGILSSAALLSERLAASGDPEVGRVVPRLLGAIDRAVELCGQTLSYSRDGVLPLRRSGFELRALVDEVGAEVLDAGRHQNGGRAVVWENRVPPGLMVLADRDQFARALANLGRNAAQAGAERVVVSAEAGVGRLTVTVADDGSGLPPRARKHLFQPFAGSARAGGTGLGLAIAREILRAHGGELRLVDSSGRGTTFALELPAGGRAG